MKAPVTIILFLFSMSITAQTEKGNWVFGVGTRFKDSFIILPRNVNSVGFGGVNLSKGNGIYSSKITNINFQPSIGYFISNNLMAGIQTGMAYSKSEAFDFRMNQISIGPEIRQYFLNGTFRPYTGVLANLSRTKFYLEDILGQNTNYTKNESMFGLYAGIAFFPYKQFSLDAQFGSESPGVTSKKTMHGLILNFGFNFFIQ